MKCIVFSTVLLACLFSYGESKKRIICYYGYWAGYDRVKPEDLDPNLCTHLVYAFFGINSDGSIRLNDKWLELAENGGQNQIQRFNNLRKKNPNLKTMAAIGGWSEGSKTFSKVVNDDSLRKTFAKNIVKFVEKHGFDGFDFDWEYPAARGGLPSDKQKFTKLIADVRSRFNNKGKGYLLSAAVSAEKDHVDKSYEVEKLAQYLDWINVMAYDYRMPNDGVLGHNAPLYASSTESDWAQKSVIDTSIKYWIKKGASAGKINLGMPMYGHSFTLKDKSKTYPGAPAKGPGVNEGTVDYYEMCILLKKDWKVVWNNEQKVPHAVKDDQWVGYDDKKSIKIKSEYVINNGLGGAKIWSVDTDDVFGKCGDGKFPLIKTIKKIFNN